MITEEPRITENGILILPSKFTSKKFEFELTRREGKYAIYKKTKPGTRLEHWEVIVIKSHNGYQLGETYCPPAECYPSDAEFGLFGWDCMTLKDAEEQLEKVKKQHQLSKRKKLE